MARARNIKPSFFTNDRLAECSQASRLLFIGLWTIADREGRLEERPKKIKAEIMPYDDCDCLALLKELQRGGFIIRYSYSDNNYIQVVNFLKHQNPHMKENASTIQAPDLSDTSTNIAPNDPGLLLIPDSLNPLIDPPIRKPGKVPVARERKIPKISFEDLNIDHIADWLAEKRTQGKYLNHDEQGILEMFKDYCRSKNPKYADYVAALRNAFNWDKAPIQGNRKNAPDCKPRKQDSQNDEIWKEIMGK